MSDKELLDTMILERIQTLLERLKEDPAKRKESLNMMDQAEAVLNRLSEQERNLMERYLDSMSERMAEEEPVLYLGGFKDGIRVMKWISSL